MGSPRVGDRVEDRRVRVVHPDGSLETATLGRLAADRPVLLPVRPGDDGRNGPTPGDPYHDFAWFASHPHVRIVGVTGSTDVDPAGLAFPMVLDAGSALADAFGVGGEAASRGRPRWDCFLVDASRTVRSRWLGEPAVGEIHADLSRRFGPPDDPVARRNPPTA